MQKYRIPFNRPLFIGNEQEYIAQAIANGHISGDGPFTKKCSEFLEKTLAVPKVLLTPSCTHALEMSALLLNLKPGDEVIMPSFTFVSTVIAFVRQAARPVFVDIRPDTLNLDESLIERLITPRTKAIIPVHYAGIGCEMDAILPVAKKHNLPVIEDNAHGLFGKYRGKLLGTFGDLAVQSFHETKNFMCGEGGALVVNKPEYIDRAEIIREKGTNRSRFFRGQVDKYTWVDIGSSYLLSDLLAAFLLAQFEAKDKIQTIRKRIWMYYSDQLTEWADTYNVRLPFVPAHCEHPYHLFYLLMPSPKKRNRLIDCLKKKGILSVFHYQPLHLSTMGKKYGYERGDCPITEEVSDRLLRLPFYNDLTEVDQAAVVDAITKFD